MAPEQLYGLPGPQSDVFSFGVMVFQLLTSTIPEQEMMNGRPSGHILAAEYERLPEAWRRPVMAMTEAELDHRLPDFDAVIQTLSSIEPSECPERDILAPSLLPHLPASPILSSRTRPPMWTAWADRTRVETRVTRCSSKTSSLRPLPIKRTLSR